MTNIYEASSTAAHGLTRRETFAWSASIRLGEDFVELRVAPEACSVDGFRHGGCRRLLIFLPETRKTERISIAREGDTDLPVKESAEVFSAHAALCGKVIHVLVPAGLSQDTQGLLHRGMYQDSATLRSARPLRPPAKQQQMLQPGIEAVWIFVRVRERRACTKAGFLVQHVRVRSTNHQRVHGAVHQVEDAGLEHCMQHGAKVGHIPTETLITADACRSQHQAGAENSDVCLRVGRHVYKVVLLFGIEPQQCPRTEGEALVADDVGDSAGVLRSLSNGMVNTLLKGGPLRAPDPNENGGMLGGFATDVLIGVDNFMCSVDSAFLPSTIWIDATSACAEQVPLTR